MCQRDPVNQSICLHIDVAQSPVYHSIGTEAYEQMLSCLGAAINKNNKKKTVPLSDPGGSELLPTPM